jgi:hypothetical protein
MQACTTESASRGTRGVHLCGEEAPLGTPAKQLSQHQNKIITKNDKSTAHGFVIGIKEGLGLEHQGSLGWLQWVSREPVVDERERGREGREGGRGWQSPLDNCRAAVQPTPLFCRSFRLPSFFLLFLSFPFVFFRVAHPPCSSLFSLFFFLFPSL